MKLRFTERVDKLKLEYLLNNCDKYEIWKSDETRPKEVFLTAYRKYLKGIDENGEIEVVYKQHNGDGRYFPKHMGLTLMPRRVRHTIRNQHDIDLDIVNCHPVIALKYSKGFGLEAPCLQRYVDNRDDVLSQIVEECKLDDPKTYILKLLNGGVHNEVGCKYLDDLNEEFELLRDTICETYPNYVEGIKKLKKDSTWNIKGFVLHHSLEAMENELLMTMVEYFEFNKIKITSLAYDELTIENKKENLVNLDKYCSEIAEKIEKVHNIEIKLKRKIMNEGFELPDTIEVRKRSPASLLRERLLHQSTSICSCQLDHIRMYKLIDYLFWTFQVKTAEDLKFTNICLFVKNKASDGCFEEIMTRLAKKYSFT